MVIYNIFICSRVGDECWVEVRCCAGIVFADIGSCRSAGGQGLAWRREERGSLLQESGQSCGNLLGLSAAEPFLLRWRHWWGQSLSALTILWRELLGGGDLPWFLSEGMLQQGRTLWLPASLPRPRAQPSQEPQDTGMAAAGNAGDVPGEVEEGSLFFELSTLLIYHTSILHHNTLSSLMQWPPSSLLWGTVSHWENRQHREIKNVRV